MLFAVLRVRPAGMRAVGLTREQLEQAVHLMGDLNLDASQGRCTSYLTINAPTAAGRSSADEFGKALARSLGSAAHLIVDWGFPTNQLRPQLIDDILASGLHQALPNSLTEEHRVLLIVGRLVDQVDNLMQVIEHDDPQCRVAVVTRTQAVVRSPSWELNSAVKNALVVDTPQLLGDVRKRLLRRRGVFASHQESSELHPCVNSSSGT
jgi:hypothetical protein